MAAQFQGRRYRRYVNTFSGDCFTGQRRVRWRLEARIWGKLRVVSRQKHPLGPIISQMIPDVAYRVELATENPKF
jgi:hypothetical protein